MKNFGCNPLFRLGGALLAAFWLLAASTQAATPGAAQVKKVVGTANYTDASGGGPIKEGQVLMAGATITTGAASYVDLDMGVNGNALRVEADSTLTLNKLEYTRAIETVVNTELDVKKGSAVANVVNKLSKASRYEIKTPAGVAGIRGTVLRAGTTRIVCLIGRVEFRPNGQGGLQLVITGGAGFQQGANQTVRATSVETTGLARTACSLTANTLANMVSQAVQQFAAAIAAEAATEVAKNGGNAAAVSAEASSVAKAVLAQLVQEVQLAAQTAPPSVKVQVQQAAAALQNNTESVGATAAASGAAAAVINNGGTAQQARAAANSAAQQSTSNQTIANQAANNVTAGSINSAIQARNQGGTVNPTENLVNNTQPASGVATGTPAGGPNAGVQTQIGTTIIFVSPGAAGGTGTTTPR